jgi:hypothetical protein
MTDRHEKLRTRLPLLIGAIPFLTAGLDGVLQGKLFLGIVNLAMAAANLLALRYAERSPDSTKIFLFLLNAVVAWVVAWDYYLTGKQGLPYAWLAAGFFFCVAALMVALKRRQRAAAPPAEETDQDPAEIE